MSEKEYLESLIAQTKARIEKTKEGGRLSFADKLVLESDKKHLRQLEQQLEAIQHEPK